MADDAKANLKYQSEIRKMSFKGVREYAASVGIELKFGATKGKLMQAIFKDKKFLEDKKEDDITTHAGASLSSFEVAKAQSPKTELAQKRSRGNSQFDLMDHATSKETSRILKRFRRLPSTMACPAAARKIINCFQHMDYLTAEEVESAIVKFDVEALGGFAALEDLARCFANLDGHAWDSLAGEFRAFDCPDPQHKRFFRLVAMSKGREKIMGMLKLATLERDLLRCHTFTHHIHCSLHEIYNDVTLSKYLIAALMILRVKTKEKLILTKLDVDWNAGHAVPLLTALMRRIERYLTAQDIFETQHFDKILEHKRVRMRGVGAIVKEALASPDDQDSALSEAIPKIIDNSEMPLVPMTPLMAELKKKTSTIKAINIETAAKQKKMASTKPDPETESMRNLRKIEFRLPEHWMVHIQRDAFQAGSYIESEDLEAYRAKLSELQESYDKLLKTNEQVMALWGRCEREYFQSHRTNFLKRIRDPEFAIVCQIVEEVWDLFMPDTVWGAIWEYRQPFEKKTEMRFALEAFTEFREKYLQ